MGMRLPTGATGQPPNIPDDVSACIENPHYGKQYLTRFEALDVINMLSAMLMADDRNKSRGDGSVRRTG